LDPTSRWPLWPGTRARARERLPLARPFSFLVIDFK